MANTTADNQPTASTTTPADEPLSYTFVRTPIPLLARAPVFDIRNGSPDNASSLLLRATIAPWAHWVPITGVAPTAAMSYIDAFYACYWVRMGTSHGSDAEKRKKLAICFAVSRAVAMAYFRIETANITPGECAAPMLEMHTPANGNPELRIISTTPRDYVREFANVPALTEDEKNIMTVLLRVCVGIIPLQGYSLMTTSHHYLSDAGSQSRKAYLAVERQFWRDSIIKDWVDAHPDDIRDVLWHKSCHPVSMEIKLAAACSETVKAQLEAAGAGSAAARLPAVETEVKTGAAYKALFDVVRPMFTMYRGDVDCTLLDLALETVQRYPPGVESPTVNFRRDERIPPNVVNRRTAVAWVQAIAKRNAAAAAHCMGFYTAMADRTTYTGAAAQVDTLRNSHALSKLTQTHQASYNVGFDQYGDYAAARAKARRKGEFEAPMFLIS